jgi:hypothetical protein
MIGATIQLLPARFRGVTVVADVLAEPLADLHRVERDVARALYVYVNPLIGGSAQGPGDGWPFGRTLNQGELFGIVHAVDGVEYVRMLRVYETDLHSGERASVPIDAHLVLAPDELLASATHVVKTRHREI